VNLIRKFWKPAPNESAELYPIKVEALVVEDVAAEAEFLCGQLRFQDVLVTWAGNLAGALECLAMTNRKFQIAFIDIGLPDSQGCEIVRLIKERRRGMRIIIVSGAPDKILPALQYGFVSVLLKPFSLGSVAEILRAFRFPTND